MSATTRRPVALVLAVVACAVAAAALLLRGTDDYAITALFPNADGLVTGGSVQVAGRKVGSIGDIALGPRGEAAVQLRIDDRSLVPLPTGTRATIRAVGLAGIANRFVDLSPGPRRGPTLRAGATLPESQTAAIVSLDALLDSFGPRNRRNVQDLIARGAQVYAGSGAPAFNRMLREVSPATREIAALSGELALDQRAITTIVQRGAVAASAVARRDDTLAAAVDHTADALGAVAAERRALAGTLERAPAFLRQATRTLGTTRTAVTTLRPALREIPPAARPLRRLATSTSALLGEVRPVLPDLTVALRRARTVLTTLDPLVRPLVDALRTGGVALKSAKPVLRALRYYGPDLILGVFNGIVGITSGGYDALGHYFRANLIQSPQTLTSGPLADLLQRNGLIPGVLNARSGLTRRCPGGLAPPAPDGSNPWLVGRDICTPEHDVPASVNVP